MSYQLPSSFLQKFTPKEIHEIKRVFKEYDADNAAEIQAQDLNTVFLKLGENISVSQTSTILRLVPTARPGIVNYQEFLGILYDIRHGLIALDTSAATAPVTSEPPSISDLNISEAFWPPAVTAEAATTPDLIHASSSPVPPVQKQGSFSQKPQWPPAAPAQETSAATTTTSMPSYPPAVFHKQTSGKAQWPPAQLPQQKSQWPPNVASSSSSSSNDMKPKWPPATSSAPAPAGKAQWPPATSSTPAPAGKTKWPPAASSTPAPAGKTQWPPVQNAPAPVQKQGSFAQKPQWPPAQPSGSPAAPASGANKPQWPPAQHVAPLAAASPAQTPAQTPAPVVEESRTSIRHISSSVSPPISTSTGTVPHRSNFQIHEVKGATGGLHSYSEEEKIAFTEHINNCLYGDKDLVDILPIATEGNGLFHSVGDGVLLCKLINAAIPDTIDVRALNIKKKLNVYEKTENNNLCINAAKGIGCSVVNIGPADLIEGKPILVLGLTWQIIKIQLTSTINLKNHPELVRLLLDGESLEDFMKLPPDQILLRWMNYHLKAAGHPNQVTNFSKDVSDAIAYSVLLHQIAPIVCDLAKESNAEDRAAHVIQNAVKLQVEPFIKPRDITSGNPKLNMSFVAQLFNNCPALAAVEEVSLLKDILEDDDIGDTREERVFRMWINSLGIDDVYVNHLFTDLRDGITILKVFDRIEKNIVSWPKVNLIAPNKFKKVENCNYAVVLGKQLKFSLVNIGGVDITEGNKKLLLSVMWQTMRYQQLKLLSSLAKTQGELITDKDIIEWANQKVRQSGKANYQMIQFRDPSLADGLYLLGLVHAVEPRAVNWEQVTLGQNEEEKASNAKYVISCARKIGATVFLTFEDIVEVKPKMIMTFVASLMSVDMDRRHS